MRRAYINISQASKEGLRNFTDTTSGASTILIGNKEGLRKKLEGIK